MFHSLERMTNSFIHVYPALAMWIVRFQAEELRDLTRESNRNTFMGVSIGELAYTRAVTASEEEGYSFLEAWALPVAAYGCHMACALTFTFRICPIPKGYMCLYLLVMQKTKRRLIPHLPGIAASKKNKEDGKGDGLHLFATARGTSLFIPYKGVILFWYVLLNHVFVAIVSLPVLAYFHSFWFSAMAMTLVFTSLLYKTASYYVDVMMTSRKFTDNVPLDD